MHWSCHKNEANGNIFITLVVYVKHMKKSVWLDCQRNEFFPKQKGIPSLVKIEHKNTATLDSARSKKKSKVAVLQLQKLMMKLHFASSAIFDPQRETNLYL